MKTTVEALKDLYVKLGGSSDDVSDDSTIPDCIDAITEVADGASGGKDLVVNDDNNGTVTISVR